MIVKSNNPETMVLHAGPRSDLATGAVAVPIFQTTSYEFRSTEHAATLPQGLRPHLFAHNEPDLRRAGAEDYGTRRRRGSAGPS
jgi:cystathionine beta-lyase/cystathionine gamma-synthase